MAWHIGSRCLLIKQLQRRAWQHHRELRILLIKQVKPSLPSQLGIMPTCADFPMSKKAARTRRSTMQKDADFDVMMAANSRHLGPRTTEPDPAVEIPLQFKVTCLVCSLTSLHGSNIHKCVGQWFPSNLQSRGFDIPSSWISMQGWFKIEN